jgi:hypothetical protein
VRAHFRYRAELQELATDEPIRRALDLDGGWRRTYARFFPDAEPFAVLTLRERRPDAPRWASSSSRPTPTFPYRSPSRTV